MKLLLLLFLCVVGTLAQDEYDDYGAVNIINILIFNRILILNVDNVVIIVLFLYAVLLQEAKKEVSPF